MFFLSALRELIGWIDQYNGTCLNKSFILPMNLTHSLLRAAIYLSDEVSVQNILELELKMGIGKHLRSLLEPNEAGQPLETTILKTIFNLIPAFNLDKTRMPAST